jgi:hypothetical protein
VQFCLTIKGLVNLPLRRAMGMTQGLLKLAGLDWHVPFFSVVGRRQKHLSVTIEAYSTTTRLHVLVNRTDIKMLGEGEWKTKNIVLITVTSSARSTWGLPPPRWEFELSR